MNKLLAILVLLISFETAPAQVTQEWVARYNGPGYSSSRASSITIDGSGNVYVTGESLGGSGTNRDYATIKYNISGDSVWVKKYNGPGNSDDGASSIALDGSGNVYVTGYSYGGSGTGYDYATIKYNSAGIEQWVARYNNNGATDDKAFSLALDGSGNVYVTGYSSSGGSDYDYATIKYNSAGIQQWVSRYNGPGSDQASSLALDGSGNVYVTGSSFGSGTGSDYTTIKYNSAGIELWVARYNGPGNWQDYASSLAVDGSGNVYVTGNSNSVSVTNNNDYATIKYNSAGIEQWVSRYNGPGNYVDAASSLVVDGFGNVYVTGSSYGSGTGFDCATIKYNSAGIEQWVAIYNGPGNYNDGSSSLALDGSGNVYVTGSSDVSNGISDDYITIKYNTAGIEQWVSRYNGPGNSDDAAFSLAVDGSGNVYVTGRSAGSGPGYDYATIKYSQSIGINQISSIVPEQFRLFQNYPNPFNPTTNIEFSLPEKSFVKLKVFDITGKEIAELVNENLSAGIFRYEFNAENLPSGLYFYKLETEKFSETKKMIILK